MIMKFNFNCLSTVFLIGAFIVVDKVLSAAPLNSDKLYFLDQNGYEVISGAEEFLTPVSPDTDNGIELSQSELSKKSPKADIFLYGKFYVLRKKGSKKEPLSLKNIKKSNVGENIFNQYPSSRRQSLPHAMDRFLQSQSQANDYHTDAILFPSEEPTKIKKYIRLPKANQDGSARPKPEQLPLESSISFQTFSPLNADVHTQKPRDMQQDSRKSTQTTTDANTDKPKPALALEKEITISQDDEPTNASEKPEDLGSMDSTEFVEWVKNNMNEEEISQLLLTEEELMEASETEDESLKTTTELDIGDKSFITIPAFSCPSGQRKIHGVCKKIYVHKVSPQNNNNNNGNPRDAIIRARALQSRKKLQAFLASLKVMEAMAEEALKEQTEAVSSSSSSSSVVVEDSSTTSSSTSTAASALDDDDYDRVRRSAASTL